MAFYLLIPYIFLNQVRGEVDPLCEFVKALESIRRSLDQAATSIRRLFNLKLLKVFFKHVIHDRLINNLELNMKVFISVFKKYFFVVCIVTFSCLAAAETSPMTYSPSIDDKPSYGCFPRDGALACRWGGQCVEKGNKCYSCGTGQFWSDELNACYTCYQGTSLQRMPDGSFKCD